MAEVRLKNICKTFKEGTLAVKNITCTIKDKEFVVLVGPSGCGKTTTLRMIAGLEDITAGELSIGNTIVNDLPPNDRQIAMVFQNYALYPHMTAYQNMAFGLKIKKVPKTQIHEKVMRAAEILNIEDILQKKPGKMSGGQRQRIAIGRAIVRDPDVFLFDEPLSNLDAKLRGKMRIELAKLHKKLDATIVYVTHDQVEAMTLGDRIIVMNQGEIMQIDTPMQLFHNPTNRFVAEFIGSPKMNIMEGQLREKGDQLFFDYNDTSLNVTGISSAQLKPYLNQRVDLGIRAEYLHAASSTLTNFTQLKMKIVTEELLGSEKLVYTEDNNQSLVAKFDSTVRVDINKYMNLYVNLDKVFLFDNKNGQRIK